MATQDEIQQELDRLGASSTDETPGLDCDAVSADGVATFTDSQETVRCDANAALAALRAATVPTPRPTSGIIDADSLPDDTGFTAAWQALTELPEAPETEAK